MTKLWQNPVMQGVFTLIFAFAGLIGCYALDALYRSMGVHYPYRTVAVISTMFIGYVVLVGIILLIMWIVRRIRARRSI